MTKKKPSKAGRPRSGKVSRHSISRRSGRGVGRPRLEVARVHAFNTRLTEPELQTAAALAQDAGLGESPRAALTRHLRGFLARKAVQLRAD